MYLLNEILRSWPDADKLIAREKEQLPGYAAAEEQLNAAVRGLTSAEYRNYEGARNEVAALEMWGAFLAGFRLCARLMGELTR